MKQKNVQKILNETEIGYDAISGKFSQTRKHFWRSLEFIKDYTHERDNVLDWGCGNGRLLELFDQQDIKYWGMDVSGKLIDIAKKKYGKDNIHFAKIESCAVSESDSECFNIPFQNNFFNTVYSIAVFHHFPSQKYRQDVARELYRVTKDEGRIIVTVWYLWQKKYRKNILQNWINKIARKSNLDWNDCEISFTDNQGTKIQRFHRAFTKKELKKLFERAGFKTEKCEVVAGRNILYIGKKD